VRLTPPVRAIFGLEIRSLLRDPRTVFISVVLPVLLLPGLLVAGNLVTEREAEREEARSYRIAVTGTRASLADTLLAGLLQNSEADSRFRQVQVENPMRALDADSVDLVVEGLEPAEWEALMDGDTAEASVPDELAGAPVIRIHFHSNRTASREGAETARRHLMETRQERRDALIVDAGFPVHPRTVAQVEGVDVATDQEVQGAHLGRFITLILLGLMVLGGSAVATDTLAGEKERGTLNTLLTSAATRKEIVTGKLLAVMAIALTIAVIQVLNLWIFLGLEIIEPPPGFAIQVSWEMAAGLLLIFLPVVALTAGILLLTSAYANSYKEAQLYLTPVLLGLALPALAPILPDISLQSAIILVPLANLSVAARDLLLGDLNLLALAGAWVVTAGAAVWVTARSIRALHDEDVITGDTSQAEFLGGPALFRKRVLIWFLVFWAVKVMIDLNLPFDDLRLAALVSVGLIFGVFPFILIRRFRLDPVKALALRKPRPWVWLGVLIGVPGGLLTAQTVFQLMDRVIPIPVELLENFGQALMPEAIPIWQLLIVVAVVPGIVEELTFRGVLLHGLRRRFGPVGLALVVGLIFGVFHFQIFRIPSTAFLGVILTAVTLMSGSIFPAILWHILNNGIAVYLGSRGVESLGEGPVMGVAGFALLALGLWIIWMSRTPYPDMGPAAGRRPSAP
jgi:sodium transport system permease protein